jgi:transcriptional regulator with XRE-family HTH domain
MNKKPLAQEIGNLVRRLRMEAGLSQEDFADKCALHRTYIGCIERGEKMMTIETADKLASACGLTLTQFFYLLENDKPS